MIITSPGLTFWGFFYPKSSKFIQYPKSKGIASQTVLGRVGETDDIGGDVASLLNGENHWINAQRIEVSGGMII